MHHLDVKPSSQNAHLPTWLQTYKL